MPAQAPELWRGVRVGGETALEFFTRVWTPYLPHGLDSETLRKFDLKFVLAINDYKSHGHHWWPPELELPTRRTKVRKTMEMLDAGRWAELSDRDILAALLKRQRDAKRAAGIPHQRPSKKRKP